MKITEKADKGIGYGGFDTLCCRALIAFSLKPGPRHSAGCIHTAEYNPQIRICQMSISIPAQVALIQNGRDGTQNFTFFRIAFRSTSDNLLRLHYSAILRFSDTIQQ